MSSLHRDNFVIHPDARSRDRTARERAKFTKDGSTSEKFRTWCKSCLRAEVERIQDGEARDEALRERRTAEEIELSLWGDDFRDVTGVRGWIRGTVDTQVHHLTTCRSQARDSSVTATAAATKTMRASAKAKHSLVSLNSPERPQRRVRFTSSTDAVALDNLFNFEDTPAAVWWDTFEKNLDMQRTLNDEMELYSLFDLDADGDDEEIEESAASILDS